jgi:hypothetical protein
MKFAGAENILDMFDIYATQIENFSLTDLPFSSLHIVYFQSDLI